MPPRVNLVALRTIEAAVTDRTAEKKKKKRPTADPGQYELRRLRKGSQVEAEVEVETARVEVETTLLVTRSISIGIPLIRASGGCLANTTQARVGMSYS